jgi:hypothetical protein
MKSEPEPKGHAESNAANTTYTENEIRAYGVRMEGARALQIVYGVGRTRAYEMLRLGDHDLPITKPPGEAKRIADRVPRRAPDSLLSRDTGPGHIPSDTSY